MIVVLLEYKVGLDVIDDLRAAHLDWLREGIAAGRLLVAGPRNPRTGGMFIARGSLDEIRDWAANDPFALAGAADYSFIEVTPSLVAPGLEALAQ